MTAVSEGNAIETFLNHWKENDRYFYMLSMLSKLSKLFSDSQIPYLDYRLAENLFCKYYCAINDARSCTAYDARLSDFGVGIKTFILQNGASSLEKVAEFNKLKPTLEHLHNEELANKISEYRNSRIDLANATYNVTDRSYHIVGRMEGMLRVFNTPYDYIDIENIRNVSENVKSLTFDDGLNEYSFMKSKSVLMKRFVVPRDFVDVPVDIFDDPISLLEQFFQDFGQVELPKLKVKGIDYVVLPLYSVRDHNVPERSGLNQWNANGRERNEDEVYIPVPIKIHQDYPNFFPQNRDEVFELVLPTGDVLSAKMCQQNQKGLMSNPNKALGNWILRKVLKIVPGELVTMVDLYRAGFDSVYVEKVHTENGTRRYALSLSNNYENYSNFIGDETY